MHKSTEVQVNSQLAVAPDLVLDGGKVTTTSLQIAAHFGKRHDNVLRTIQNLEIPQEFHALNFEAMSADVTVANGAVRKTPIYRITRDGFALLAMGFTGKEAAHWKVAYIQAFNKMEAELLARQAPASNPAIEYARITPAHAQDLKEIVNHAVEAGVFKTHGEGWRRFQNKFGVNSYLALPESRYKEARNYLIAKLPNGYAGPELETDTPDAGGASTENLKKAYSLASEVGQHVSQTVFSALMEGKEGWEHDRFLFALNYDRNNQRSVPWVKQLEREAMVASFSGLAKMIREPGGFCPSNVDMADLAAACNQRLAERMAYEYRKSLKTPAAVRVAQFEESLPRPPA